MDHKAGVFYGEGGVCNDGTEGVVSVCLCECIEARQGMSIVVVEDNEGTLNFENTFVLFSTVSQASNEILCFSFQTWFFKD